MLPWYVFALLSALFSSAMSIARKKALSREHALPFAATRALFMGAVLASFLPFLDLQLSGWMWAIIYVNSVVLTVAIVCMAKAIRHEEISSLVPLKNLVPALSVIWATLFLGEQLAGRQLFGIGLILVGAYVLEVDHGFRDVLSPFKKLSSHYVLLFVLAMGFLSVTAIVEKFLLNLVNAPLEVMMVSWLFIALNFTLYQLVREGSFAYVVSAVRHSRGLVFLVGVFAIGAVLFYFLALSRAFVSLVLPIKQASSLFTTVVGGELFHDHGLPFKIAACVIMLAGVYLVLV